MPYLLRGLDIARPNQVWSIDITYIPMLHGFMYLTTITDVYSRCIMAWGLHNALIEYHNNRRCHQGIVTDGEIQKCNMNENNVMKTMAFQELFLTLQHPSKDDGETLRCCLPCGAERLLLLP